MWLKVAISWYLIGLLIFLSSAVFSVSFYGLWEEGYYLWDKTKDFLLWGTVLYQTGKLPMYVRPVLLLSSLRLLWELISIQTGMSVNDPVAVGVLFIAVDIVCLYLFVKEIKWQKRKS